MKIDRRDLRKPAGLELSDKSDTQTSDKIKKGIVKRLSINMLESRFTISFYKKSGEECKSYEKVAERISFLERKGKGRKRCLLSARILNGFSGPCIKDR